MQFLSFCFTISQVLLCLNACWAVSHVLLVILNHSPCFCQSHWALFSLEASFFLETYLLIPKDATVSVCHIALYLKPNWICNCVNSGNFVMYTITVFILFQTISPILSLQVLQNAKRGFNTHFIDKLENFTPSPMHGPLSTLSQSSQLNEKVLEALTRGSTGTLILFQ